MYKTHKTLYIKHNGAGVFCILQSFSKKYPAPF